MNPNAFDEMLALIMLDDCVQRRKALDNWSRRWIATLEAMHPAPKSAIAAFEKVYPEYRGRTGEAAKHALAEIIAKGLLSGEAHALRWEVSETSDTVTTKVSVHFILQEPKEIA